MKHENWHRTDERFRHLLGKRVECIDENGQRWVGQLWFAGINHNLRGAFQVTVNRTPLWPADPNTIKQVPELDAKGN